MQHPLRPALAILALVLLLPLLVPPARAEIPDSAKVARAALAETPPVIDGRLDEPAWQAAPPFDDFVERSPALRGLPAERTTFRLLADGDALYVGIVCHDTQPATIRARTMQRDSTALFDDDAISVKIDPLRDRRTTYGFGMNAAGGRIDYRGINDGTWQIEVDLVWEGAADTHAEGWSAEFKIPWSSLGIDPSAPPAETGFEISRDQSRLHATYDWALLAPPHSPIAASQYGTLEGLRELLAKAAPAKARSTWAFLPWARAGFDDAPDSKLEAITNAGFDVEAELGAGFATTFTLNTDFAQVEVDDVTTNLDRFDLFLPEKRDFFLKDGDLFEFGESGWASLFHSRTIGLVAQDSATELPILAGVKLGGRTAGGLNLGALTVLTRPDEGVPWRLDSVLRLQQTFDGSALGIMSTLRQPLEGESAHNLTLGIDGHVSPEGSPLLVRSFFATSIDRDEGDDAETVDVAGHVDLRWRGELFRPRAGFAWFGPSFRSELGYFQRTGIMNPYAELVSVPRLGGALKTLGIFALADFTLSAPDADLLDWANQYGLQLDWDSGLWIGLFGGPGEVTVDAFSLGGHAVEAGVHGQSRIQLEGGTPSTEVISAYLSIEHREFFGGTAWLFGGSLVARPGTWLRITLDSSLALASLPSGDFDAPTLNLRLSSSLTTDLEFSAFGGWSGLEDLISIQSRLRWTFGHGHDLFAVWELRLDEETGIVQHHSFVAKVALRLP